MAIAVADSVGVALVDIAGAAAAAVVDGCCTGNFAIAVVLLNRVRARLMTIAAVIYLAYFVVFPKANACARIGIHHIDTCVIGEQRQGDHVGLFHSTQPD